MIPGVGGQLVSGSYLESRVSTCEAPAGPARAIASALWTATQSIGPASSVRSMLQSAAMPLTIALGFPPAAEPTETAHGIVVTLAGNPHPLALLVTRFGERLDPLWRETAIAARDRQAEWALLYNGVTLRLIDATRMHARRYLDFDLQLSSNAAGVGALWLTLAAGSLCSDGALSTRSLVAASDRHAANVCRSLRHGVLGASADILDALIRGRTRRSTALRDSFEQALTIVYRLLFLLFAEARGLVPLWHPVYRESYSVEALRNAAERSRATAGAWDAVRAMTRLAHAGCHAGDLRVTPFNGRLFAPSRTPLAERRDLDDEKARAAVLALATRTGGERGTRERITYRDLGVEQLGAVYETLLDYEPAVEAGRVALRPESGVRKATGTFYTPQPIAEHLVRTTLSPLVQDRTADQILRLRIVDPAMGSGAFLVAACRFLADAYETALVAAGDAQPHDIDDHDRALFRRRVAERCLYGVDLNPMAVQLARLSLWLATLAADRPLSFLDHRLMTGNSLVGSSLSRLRQAPHRVVAASMPTPTLFDAADVGDALRHALPIRFSLESTPNDTLAQVQAKERAHAAASGRESALARWRQIADAWCAAWFSPAVPAAAFGAIADRLLRGAGALPPRTIAACLDAAAETARTHRFFHWELEYPEAFFDDSGARLANAGFDAVIGNPPWNIVHTESAAFLRFARDAGIYHAHGQGHANRYQLFVERAVTLTRSGGRIGLVLPWGFAADHGSAPLRRLVMNRTDVDAMIAFDNHRGVFPIHRSVRFTLLTATAGGPTGDIACAFGLDDPAALESLDRDRPSPPVRLSPSALRRLSGDSLAIPYVRAPVDVAIVERAAALFPPLHSAEGWGASFGRELNATDDRALFRAGGRGWPVVEGKHVAPFRADVAAAERWVAPTDARRALGERCERPRLAYRDVASATNRVTLIAALLPSRCVSTHTLFCLRTPSSLRSQHTLCGLFNSLVVNFLVRLRVTTHVTTAIVEQLPIPPWRTAPAAAAEISALARLLRGGHRPAAFARLNALVARWYQLTDDEFARVLETFPLIDRAERARMMEMFVRLPARR